jgi:hypothetical protein
MRVPVVVTAMAALLSACASPQQQAADEREKVDQMMAVYGPACSKLGYQEQTDPWRNCVLQLYAQRNNVVRYAYDTGLIRSCVGRRGFYECEVW